mmetsp:Transcript_10726/g.41670  ORF Transcript_10726/g.41670 Transcript_10726/m.41670 type:complete len:286 (-) Transcript_10726:1052-1909(-)
MSSTVAWRSLRRPRTARRVVASSSPPTASLGRRPSPSTAAAASAQAEARDSDSSLSEGGDPVLSTLGCAGARAAAGAGSGAGTVPGTAGLPSGPVTNRSVARGARPGVEPLPSVSLIAGKGVPGLCMGPRPGDTEAAWPNRGGRNAPAMGTACVGPLAARAERRAAAAATPDMLWVEAERVTAGRPAAAAGLLGCTSSRMPKTGATPPRCSAVANARVISAQAVPSPSMLLARLAAAGAVDDPAWSRAGPTGVPAAARMMAEPSISLDCSARQNKAHAAPSAGAE